MSILTMPHWDRPAIAWTLISLVYAIIIFFLWKIFEESVVIASLASPLILALIIEASTRLKSLIRTDSSTKNNTGIWHFSMLVFTILGLQVTTLAVAAIVTVVSLDGMNMQEEHADLTRFTVQAGMIVLNCLVYLSAGFLCGKTVGSAQYRIAMLAALTVVGFDMAAIFSFFYILNVPDETRNLVYVLLGLFAILYVAMILAGTKLGSSTSPHLAPDSPAG